LEAITLAGSDTQKYVSSLVFSAFQEIVIHFDVLEKLAIVFPTTG